MVEGLLILALCILIELPLQLGVIKLTDEVAAEVCEWKEQRNEQKRASLAEQTTPKNVLMRAVDSYETENTDLRAVHKKGPVKHRDGLLVPFATMTAVESAESGGRNPHPERSAESAR